MIAPGAPESSEQRLRALEQRLKQLNDERAEVLQAIEEFK